MRSCRPLLALALLALSVSTCGGGGDVGSNETTLASPATETGAGDSVDETDDHGTAQFTLSGGYEASGDWAFVPEASYFDGSSWALTFTDPSWDGDVLISMNLNPEVLNFAYADPEIGITGTNDNCSFDIDQQSASGASGSVECTDLTGISPDGTNTEVVNLSVTFDART